LAQNSNPWYWIVGQRLFDRRLAVCEIVNIDDKQGYSKHLIKIHALLSSRIIHVFGELLMKVFNNFYHNEFIEDILKLGLIS